MALQPAGKERPYVHWKTKARFQLNALLAVPQTPRVEALIKQLKDRLNTRQRKGWRVICPECGHKFYRPAARSRTGDKHL